MASSLVFVQDYSVLGSGRKPVVSMGYTNTNALL